MRANPARAGAASESRAIPQRVAGRRGADDRPALQRPAGLGPRRLRLRTGRRLSSTGPPACACTGRRRSAAGSAARRDGDGVTVFDGSVVIATGAATSVEVAVPAPVEFAEAEAAALAYPGFRDHAFSSLLRLRARAGARGRSPDLPGPGRGAGPRGGAVGPGCLAGRRPRDRPAGVPVGRARLPQWLGAHRRGRRRRPMLLGEFAVRLLGRVRPGERCVVVGWTLGGEGRRRFAGAALFGDRRGAPRAWGTRPGSRSIATRVAMGQVSDGATRGAGVRFPPWPAPTLSSVLIPPRLKPRYAGASWRVVPRWTRLSAFASPRRRWRESCPSVPSGRRT